MTNKFHYKPGPKSRTRKRVIAKVVCFDEESRSSDNDDAISVSKTPDFTANKSNFITNQCDFQTPDVDVNATDYGLEFTTDHIPNPSPRRCSTPRLTVNTRKERENANNADRTTEEMYTPVPVFSKQQQTKTKEIKETTKQATQSNMEKPQMSKQTTTCVARKPRKQPYPLQAKRQFLTEVQALQNRTDNLIPLLPFSRLVGELMRKASTDVTRITATAMEALQTSTELYITQVLQDAYLLTLHGGRVTLDVKDIQLINYLKLNFV